MGKTIMRNYHLEILRIYIVLLRTNVNSIQEGHTPSLHRTTENATAESKLWRVISEIRKRKYWIYIKFGRIHFFCTTNTWSNKLNTARENYFNKYNDTLVSSTIFFLLILNAVNRRTNSKTTRPLPNTKNSIFFSPYLILIRILERICKKIIGYCSSHHDQ